MLQVSNHHLLGFLIKIYKIVLSLVLAKFTLLWHMVMYEQRTVKMKITQMNDKVIITYINLKKGKVHISIEPAFKKKKNKKRERKKSHYTSLNYLAKVKEL